MTQTSTFMSPQSLLQLDPPTVKMLAIIEEWTAMNVPKDNTSQYLLLVLVKAGLDVTMLYLCKRKLYTSFISICSLSIVLADMLQLLLVAMVWLLGPSNAPTSLCVILATSSAAHAALPLPAILFILLDYILGDKHYRVVRNILLNLLLWGFAVAYASDFMAPELMEIEYLDGTKAVVCEIQESMLVTYTILGIFIVTLCSLLSFSTWIVQWLREAEELSSLREEPKKSHRSDLHFTFAGSSETKTLDHPLEKVGQQRPPLMVSMVLCLCSVWLPYFIITVVCVVLRYEVPAYISVNLLWLECTNSTMVGMLFWFRSKEQGPYCNIPENVCQWGVYWHLNRGMQMNALPVAVFNPSQQKRNTFYYI